MDATCFRGSTRLPISKWSYKVEDGSVRHIGPMAQDFAAAFGLGSDDRSIGTVDADGVALAAMQALLRDREGEGLEDPGVGGKTLGS